MTSARQFGALAIAFGIVGSGAVLLDVSAQAAQATASVGATIYGAGSIGTVTTETTVVQQTTVVRQTFTGSNSIPAIPVSTTTNIGFDAPAPTPAPAASGGSGTRTAAAPRFQRSGLAVVPVGPSAAIAVAGAPNQAYAVILPQQTVFSNGASLVSYSGFEHSAGLTPSLDASGADVFSVGAVTAARQAQGGQSGQQQSGGDQPAGSQQTSAGAGGAGAGGRETVLAQAFSPSAPFVSIVVSYN